MVTLETLRSQGWYLSEEGLKTLTQNGIGQDIKHIIKNALDVDLKDIGAPILATELTNNKIHQVVLQIQKLKNISAPKSNEDSQAAPRMLKLILTDGHSHCQAIEVNHVSGLHHSRTPPGTKVLINGAKIANGYVLIEPLNCTVLGGKVPVLYEKWEVAKSVTNSHQRMVNAGSDGPPAWVNFGHKIVTSIEGLGFKSLDSKGKDDKQNSEFDAQRKDAIAEAASGGVRKVFGGGTKQALLSQDGATRKNNGQSYQKEQLFNQRQDRNNRRGRREPKEKEEKPQRPSENISLFDFLANKIPVVDTPPSQSETSKVVNDNRSSNQKGNNFRYGNKNLNQQQNKYPPNGQNHYNNIRPPRFSSQFFPLPNKNDKYPPISSSSMSYNGTTGQPAMKYQESNSTESSDIKNFYNSNENPRKNQRYDKTSSNNVTNNSNATASVINKEKVDSRNVSAVERRAYSNTNVDGITDQVGKLNLNSEFASRSFRQHLGLTGGRRSNAASSSDNRFTQQSSSQAQYKQPHNNEGQQAMKLNSHSLHNAANSGCTDWMWTVGDQCMAKYWEDGKYYRATVTDITNRTCVVQFNDYGNFEEVLKTDCIPLTTEEQESQFTNVTYNGDTASEQEKNFSGSMEFRRGGNRSYPNNRNPLRQRQDRY